MTLAASAAMEAQKQRPALTLRTIWSWYACPFVMSSGLSISLDARLVLSHL